ncbi:hypothetical protein K9L97_05310 [Candidatus Woesearchaeota archaeon]|nr:hypothetical protein [Candidatus Woesearchaeota archaeon]
MKKMLILLLGLVFVVTACFPSNSCNENGICELSENFGSCSDCYPDFVVGAENLDLIEGSGELVSLVACVGNKGGSYEGDLKGIWNTNEGDVAGVVEVSEYVEFSAPSVNGDFYIEVDGQEISVGGQIDEDIADEWHCFTTRQTAAEIMGNKVSFTINPDRIIAEKSYTNNKGSKVFYENAEDTTNGSTTNGSACVDEDDGNIYVAGTTYVDDVGVAQDSCLTANRLSESLCDDDEAVIQEINCGFGCLEGACLHESGDECATESQTFEEPKISVDGETLFVCSDSQNSINQFCIENNYEEGTAEAALGGGPGAYWNNKEQWEKQNSCARAELKCTRQGVCDN